MSKPHVGMIGLAVMGSNLARNIESRGFSVAVYNRTGEVTKDFMSKFSLQDGKAAGFVASYTLEDFVKSMATPRQIFIMVKAGAGTDAVIDQLAPLLDKGDIVIDGGNAYFKDTVRRENALKAMGLNFLGIGISGGEEGALKGPSLMPGGPKDAWKIIAPLLEKIAAQVDGPRVRGGVSHAATTPEDIPLFRRELHCSSAVRCQQDRALHQLAVDDRRCHSLGGNQTQCTVIDHGASGEPNADADADADACG